MTGKDKVTVIIPVYNARETVEGAVQSALAQTWTNLEILLVDDGSTDGSGVICDRLAGQEERVRVFHRLNRGVSAARNTGLEAATGAFVTFLDADDRLRPRMVETLLALLHEQGAQIAGCGYAPLTPEEATAARAVGRAEASSGAPENETPDGKKTAPPDGKHRTPSAETKREIYTYSGEAFVELGLLRADTRIWSKLFDRALIGERRFDERLTIGEDMLFLLSLLPDCAKIAETAEPLYGYYVNPKGAMEKPYAPSFMDQARCWEEAERFLRRRMPAVYENGHVRRRLAAIQCISVMLVASKLSYLPRVERRRYAPEIASLRRKLRAYRQTKGCFAALPAGYKCKVWLFQHWPRLYLALYSRLRRQKA